MPIPAASPPARPVLSVPRGSRGRGLPGLPSLPASRAGDGGWAAGPGGADLSRAALGRNRDPGATRPGGSDESLPFAAYMQATDRHHPEGLRERAPAGADEVPIEGGQERVASDVRRGILLAEPGIRPLPRAAGYDPGDVPA